jgi:phage host-nuclease inhibitor protein Gam
MKKSIEVKGGIDTREELERAMGEYAAATLALEACRVEMEDNLRRIRDEYEQELAGLKLAAEAPFKQLELWARRHPEAFEGRKSLELTHGTIGYRTGMPRVTLKRGTDENALCGLLEAHGYARAVRVAKELDKEEIIRCARSESEAEKHFAEGLASEFGLKVSQTERFYAEARRDEEAGR